jgi:hypothetical protein
MLFNFFKKKPVDNDKIKKPNEILAKISYIISKDSDSTIVDVELEDYSDEAITSLSYIIDTLAEDRSILETMNIVKNALVEEGREDCLIKIFNLISKDTKAKIINGNKDNKADEPCIKPSDVFTK